MIIHIFIALYLFTLYLLLLIINLYCTEIYYAFCDIDCKIYKENVYVWQFVSRCTPGYYCPFGSSTQKPCISGSYQDQYYGTSCYLCPEGFFCNGIVLNDTQCSLGVQLPELCPRGFYCPPGMKTGKEYGCPTGWRSFFSLL